MARQTHTLRCGLTLAFLLQILSVTQVIIVGPYLAILLFLFLIPLGMYSPCIREMGTLGPKPALIGHRGAPMVGLKKLFYVISSSSLCHCFCHHLLLFLCCCFSFPPHEICGGWDTFLVVGTAGQRLHCIDLLKRKTLFLRDKTRLEGALSNLD